MQIRRVLVCFFCLSFNAWGQQCDNSRPFSTPDDKFVLNVDGTVTELESGLTWMRCALGQQWSGTTCEGEAKSFTWAEAYKEEDKVNIGAAYANLHNWRIPKLPELASIVERQCQYPRINLNVFPATPLGAFWTANQKNATTVKSAFAMDFEKEGVKVKSQQTKLFLRLVSGR